jgi:hypothetical protein
VVILNKVLIKKIVKDGSSQFQNFRMTFHNFHALFSTKLSQAVLRKMGSENVHECAQNGESGFGFDDLERYRKDCNEFLSHVVTGDKTWVSFVNVETKEQSKQ